MTVLVLKPDIDKDVPIPQQSKTNKKLPIPRHNGEKRRTVYPFRRMEVGDSFFLPHGGKAAAYVAIHGFRHSIKGDWINRTFTLRQWTQDGIYGYRIWRLT